MEEHQIPVLRILGSSPSWVDFFLKSNKNRIIKSKSINYIDDGKKVWLYVIEIIARYFICKIKMEKINLKKLMQMTNIYGKQLEYLLLY